VLFAIEENTRADAEKQKESNSMKKLLYLMVFFFLFSGYAFAVVDAKKSYEAAVKACEDGNYEKAIKLLKQAKKAGLSSEKERDLYYKLYLSIIKRKYPGFKPKLKKALYLEWIPPIEWVVRKKYPIFITVIGICQWK